MRRHGFLTNGQLRQGHALRVEHLRGQFKRGVDTTLRVGTAIDHEYFHLLNSSYPLLQLQPVAERLADHFAHDSVCIERRIENDGAMIRC